MTKTSILQALTLKAINQLPFEEILEYMSKNEWVDEDDKPITEDYLKLILVANLKPKSLKTSSYSVTHFSLHFYETFSYSYDSSKFSVEVKFLPLDNCASSARLKN